MEDALLIVGLGNPGSEYARTRHNAGFMALERLAVRWKSDWRLEKRFEARVASVASNPSRLWLCQPQTFMNASGEAVARLAAYYRVTPGRILVISDDADLPLGELRMRPAGGTGGHHGLESIQAHLGTQEYPRLKIGIGRRADGVRQISGHVLGRISDEESKLLDRVLDRAADQAECWSTAGIQKAMNQFNGIVTVPDSEKQP
jgi:PTH1 family peptidyl-tRNA hydrolase